MFTKINAKTFQKNENKVDPTSQTYFFHLKFNSYIESITKKKKKYFMALNVNGKAEHI